MSITEERNISSVKHVKQDGDFVNQRLSNATYVLDKSSIIAKCAKDFCLRWHILLNCFLFQSMEKARVFTSFDLLYDHS